MDVEENMQQKFIIPEEIPANERTAFHGAAAAAAKAGKKSFSFGGKTHPVTMKKDLANKIADQKESAHEDEKEKEMDPEVKKEKLKKKTANAKNGETATMNPKMDSGKEKGSGMEQKEQTIRDKLMAVLEGDRAKHYKGAAEAETMDDKYKGDGAKKMKKDHEGETVDKLPQAFDDASKAGRATKAAPKRKGDSNVGDKAVINAISKAYREMKEDDEVLTVLLTEPEMLELVQAEQNEVSERAGTVHIDYGSDGETRAGLKKHAADMKKKYGVSVKGNPKDGSYSMTGSKRGLKKALKHHDDPRLKDIKKGNAPGYSYKKMKKPGEK